MTQPAFNPQEYLPHNYYPWPDQINPHVAQAEEEYHSWCEQGYAYLPEKAREKYKRMKLHYCTARMVPDLSYGQLIPCIRFLLFQAVYDDQLEYCTREEIEQSRERLVGIFRGDEPTAEENGLYHQAALIRDEYRAFMPPEWIDRFVEGFHRVTRYGAAEEAAFKTNIEVPPLVLFRIIREYSVLMYPYIRWAEIQLERALPRHIIEHPVIGRINTLMARVVAWQNDFHSLPKELGLKSEVFNIVLVTQHEYALSSLEDAARVAMRTHDEDLMEFVALQANLPDFGTDNELVAQYVHYLGVMTQGINSFYIKDNSGRYLPLGAGFAWPEHAGEAH